MYMIRAKNVAELNNSSIFTIADILRTCSALHPERTTDRDKDSEKEERGTSFRQLFKPLLEQL